jgi:uncharacterized repeat protein (TIGR03803 family)
LASINVLRIALVIVLFVVAGRAFNANAQTETLIHLFAGSPTDGTNPRGGLVQGSDGNFYGTTLDGGTNGDGTVFRISPSGTYTTLYSFAGFPIDGVTPTATLVQGSDGNFYGTTFKGGSNNFGTVFRISSSGTYTSLYSFASSSNDGGNPLGGLVQGSSSNFYGTTYVGGASGRGTVFRISSSGSYTSLYSFANSPDGANPSAVLVQGSDGNFYGTTYSGGGGPCYDGCGTVFRISPSGTCTTLYAFVGSPVDGYNPETGLVQGSDGNFYGTTTFGGTNGNSGDVFRISPSGSYMTLYSLVGSPSDGANPYAGLVQGSDGNFYGTTLGGWTNGNGTVFRISPSGSYTTLYAFVGSPSDGANPYAGLVQGSDGNFYGTTLSGGTNNNGTIFRLAIPLNPPANQISAIQGSGTNVIFNIPSVAGETYQLQFSSSMTPTNWVNEGGTITSIGSLLTLTNFAGANQPQGFYRFAITP